MSQLAESGFRFRYVLSTCLYGNGRIEQILPEVRKTGAEFIDVWPKNFGGQREQMDEIGLEKTAALLKQRKVRIGALSRYDLGPFGLEPELKVARVFRCQTIVCGARGPRGLAGAELKAAVREFAESMKPHIAAASEAGVTIGIENHGSALIEHPDSLKWLVEFTPPGLGIALAPYHLDQDPVAIARLIRELGNRIVFFYAWQHGKGLSKELTSEQVLEQLPGRGPMDFRPIAGALKQVGYAGWVAVYMHTVPGGKPIRESTHLVTAEVERARKYFER